MASLLSLVKIVTLCLATGNIFHLVHGQEWNYDSNSPYGPDHWAEFYPACGGQSQSPVNIISASTVPFNPPDLVFTNYDRVATYTLLNTGHSAEISTNVKDITITGGGLNGTYVLEQFHFHWGTNSTTGSEHLVDSAAHSFEIHFVHYNSDRYSNVASAIGSGDPEALGLIAVFVDDVGGTPSAELGVIADSLANVPYKGNVTTLSPMSLLNLLPLSALRDYFRYHGGLTTPPCTEVAIGNVYNQAIYIAPEKLALFRQLHSNAAGQPDVLQTFNYRPPQALNGRIINRATSTPFAVDSE
jgi:carbonic anhydrase